jgi:hypothetical protein
VDGVVVGEELDAAVGRVADDLAPGGWDEDRRRHGRSLRASVCGEEIGRGLVAALCSL